MDELKIDISQYKYLYIEITKPNLTLDLDALHQEMTMLSTLVLDYGDLLSEVKYEQSGYKSLFCSNLRENDLKISESKVKASVEEDSVYNQFQKNVDKLKSILDALYTHRKMLEKLTDLWVNEYWNSSKDLKQNFKERGNIVRNRGEKEKEKTREDIVDQQREALNK